MPHSNLVEMMMDALDNDVINEQPNDVDVTLMKWFSKFY